MAGEYVPFTPAYSQNPLVNIGMMQTMNMLGGYGSTMLPPTGYSNAVFLADRLKRDREHQQMMEVGSFRSSQQIADVTGNLAAMVMAQAGKQISPREEMAFQNFARFVQQNTAGFLVQGNAGRAVLDVAAGGNNIVNLHSAMALQMRRMRSPISQLPQLSVAEADMMATGMFEQLFTGSPLEIIQQTGGFRAGQMVQMIDYLGRSGRLRTGQSISKVLDNPEMMRAIRAGDISQGDLERAGLGGVREFIDADMTDPAVQSRMSKISGGMAGASVTGLARSLAAIKELYESDGIMLQHAELLEVFDRFTSTFGQQLSPGRIEMLVRKTHTSLKDFGYGMDEIMQLSQVAQGIGRKYGFASGSVDSLMSAGAGAMAAGKRSGFFAMNAYGMLNPEQLGQLAMEASARYVQSPQGQINAVALRLGDMGTITDTAEGARAKQILEEMNAGAEISDQDYMQMTPAQRMAFWAKATGQSTATISQMMGENFANERRMNLNPGGTDLMQRQDQAMETRKKMRAQMATAAGSIGIMPGESGLTGMLADAAAESYMNMTSEVLLDETLDVDKNLRNIQGASDLHKRLTDAAAAGDKQAQAYLDRLGPDREAQLAALRRNFSRMVDRTNIKGNSANAMAMFSDENRSAFMQGKIETEMTTSLRSLFQGTSLDDKTAALANLTRALGGQIGADGQVVDGSISGADLMNSILNSKSARLDETSVEQLRQVLNQQIADYESVANDPKAAMGRRKLMGARAEVLRNLMETKFDELVGETPEQAAAQAGGGAGVPVSSEMMASEFATTMEELRKKPFTMSNVTINLDGETRHFGNGHVEPRGTANTVE